jgi:hypothetical protein
MGSTGRFGCNVQSNENYIKPIAHTGTSASARISKVQGYQGFLRKRAGSSFGQKKGQFASYKEKFGKMGQNFTTFRVNKMFSHKF